MLSPLVSPTISPFSIDWYSISDLAALLKKKKKAKTATSSGDSASKDSKVETVKSKEKASAPLAAENVAPPAQSVEAVGA